MSDDSKQALSRHILIVEDDMDILMTLRDRLDAEGCHVDAVRSGMEALLKVSEKPYGAVILDMRLPDMSGTSVQKALAARHPNLPIIVLSAERSQKLKQACFDSGAAAYLTKPCDFNKLRTVVRKVLRE